ncbi:hypothetical protein WICMUC_004831 [Wickerhamomyces mucosus]|uniref:Protein kinase domain-containing protein n=1 Tax=Wickerhamomyces mucosus TaxID=1378264 RepID=A0A9P8PES3_9ASCO|nr:hypothetical protein WICMUC_004831 [Wickerhamomyces mucosus]
MTSLSLNNNRKKQKLDDTLNINSHFNGLNERDSSLIVFDTDDNNNDHNDHNSSIINNNILFDDKESSTDSIIFIKENDLTKSFTNNSILFDNHQPIHIGIKKRRTNSLPQLPLSQIGYTRVSKLYKVDEVKPNFISPNYVTYSSSLSTTTTSSSSSSSSSSSNSTIKINNNFKSSPNSSISSDHNNNRLKNNHSNILNPSTISINSENSQSLTDENGYYIANIGEYFANNRFKILSILGQGTFGKVIKALDLQNNETVAIKIIRAIPKYREASKIELRILTALKNADPNNENHCIHLKEVLDYKNHICIITDLLDISLYEFLAKNKFKPFPGSQIQAISRQLIRSIAFLHDLKLIHTDLKPENILLKNSSFAKFKKNSYKVLKNPLINIIDFGSAIFSDEYHSELVSTRHYRAPEIVLGIGWSFECDLWSLGCILTELVTGEALFNTHENAEHLKIMELLLEEKIPNNMITRINNDSIKSLFKPINGKRRNYKLNYPIINSSPPKSINFLKTIKPLDDLISTKLNIKIDYKLSIYENYLQNDGLKYDLETISFWWNFIDLIYKLLKFDPKDRISAVEILENHGWWDYGIIDEATSGMV